MVAKPSALLERVGNVGARAPTMVSTPLEPVALTVLPAPWVKRSQEAELGDKPRTPTLQLKVRFAHGTAARARLFCARAAS